MILQALQGVDARCESDRFTGNFVSTLITEAVLKYDR